MKKTSRILVTAAGIIGLAAISFGLTNAYLISNEAHNNTFTIGEVKISATEPSFDPAKAKRMKPKQAIAKDPIIENIGENDAIVFYKVSSPVKEMTVIDEDGHKPDETEVTELFDFYTADEGAVDTDLSGFRKGFREDWIELPDVEEFGYKEGDTSVRVFAYRTSLSKGDITTPLFDAVRIQNYLEGEMSVNDVYRIIADAYAIQASNIIGSDGSDISTVMNVDSLTDIYRIYINQNGEKDASTGELNPDDPYIYDENGMIKEPEIPTKTGYTFMGWADENGNELVFPIAKENVPADGLKYHAIWEPIHYTVRFHRNPQTAEEGEDVTYDQAMTYDVAATLLPSSFGGNFFGWRLSPTGPVSFRDQQQVKNLADTNGEVVDLYAKIEVIRRHITFDANGGKFGDDSAVNDIVYSGEGTILSGAYQTPERYQGWLLRWYTDPGCTPGNEFGTYDEENDIFTLTELPDEDITVYALYRYNWLYFTPTTNQTTKIKFTINGTLTNIPSLQYSFDGNLWNNYTFGSDISVPNGQKCYFKGDNPSFCKDTDNYIQFSVPAGIVNSGGSVMSLVDSHCQSIMIPTDWCFACLFKNCSRLAKAPELPADILTKSCYSNMFYNCDELTEAPELPATTLAEKCYVSMFEHCSNMTKAPSKLPATELANYCYYGMFWSCVKLSKAPELPATTMALQCYQDMFYNCTSLTEAPELPATTLANQCYGSMFYGCTSLTEAPELPATKLVDSCYYGMFYECTALTEAPELPATILANSCYSAMFNGCMSLTEAPELPVTALASNCYRYMFENCTTLLKAPELPATTLFDYCYSEMFRGCASLTETPNLPATALAEDCYSKMFYDCTSLTEVPELPATKLEKYCYNSMFYNCKNIKVSATQTDEYFRPYRIPLSGTGTNASMAIVDMFTNTGGPFTGSPSINTTYYLPAKVVQIPKIQKKTFYYDSNEHTVSILGYNESLITQTEGITTAKEIGTYTITFMLKDKVNYAWSDGTTSDKTVTWSITDLIVTLDSVENVPGSLYGFELKNPCSYGVNGFYESMNKGISNSAALTKVTFTVNVTTDVTINVYQNAESSYDYGMLSQLDTTMPTAYNSNSGYAKSFSGSQKSTMQSYTYTNVAPGTHFIYVKYRKDGGGNYNNDSFAFQLVEK